MSLTKESKLPAELNQLMTHPRKFRKQNRLGHVGGTRVPGNPVMNAESLYLHLVFIFINNNLMPDSGWASRSIGPQWSRAAGDTTDGEVQLGSRPWWTPCRDIFLRTGLVYF
jgi:hypothetical protein